MQTNNNRYSHKHDSKLEEVERAQKQLNDLKSELAKERVNDPEGRLKKRAGELEERYDRIKRMAKEKATKSEEAISELKDGFVKAWKELKTAAESARSSSK